MWDKIQGSDEPYYYEMTDESSTGRRFLYSIYWILKKLKVPPDAVVLLRPHIVRFIWYEGQEAGNNEEE